MIIDLDLKLWLLTDASRPALSGAHYQKEAHTLTVTNGKALIVVPVRDDEDDETGIIPADVLKEATKLGKGRTALPVEVKVKAGNATLRDGRSWPLLAGPYPQVTQTIPNGIGWNRKARVILNAELLKNLADAAGAKNDVAVTLEFNTHDDGDADGGPMLATTGKAATAVIMPMRFPKSQKDKRTSADVKDGDMGARTNAANGQEVPK